MDDLELDDRGYFWLSEEVIPDGKFAPDNAVHGRVTVNRSGTIRLDLDASILQSHSALFNVGQSVRKDIFGILRQSGLYVSIHDIVATGTTIRSSGISGERFTAKFCFTSRSCDFVGKKTNFDFIEIDLSCIESWVPLNSIEYNNTKEFKSIKYRNKKDFNYTIGEDHAEILFFLNIQQHSSYYFSDIQFKEYCFLRYFKNIGSAETASMLYQKLTDFLFLFIEKQTSLLWPRLRSVKSQKLFTFYFNVVDLPKVSISHTDCLLQFSDISTDFGHILTNWMNKRDFYGPGFYLYLSLRRGMDLYNENRFMNMIWGLEAFHRNLGATATNRHLENKIHRIIQQIERKSDRRWLERSLNRNLEPNLSSRLESLFSRLPLPLDKSFVQSFSSTCARYRNDISHYGEARPSEQYDSFSQNLFEIEAALDILYHFLILHEIGVPEEKLLFIFENGFKSFNIQMVLWNAGLLKDDPRNSV